MTVAISNGIVILLLFLQNTSAQQAVSNAVNNAVSQQKATCNTAGLNFNTAQPGQQINWQQSSNTQQPTYQQPGSCAQMKQQNTNPLADIFSALQNLRFSSQKPQTGNPSTSGYNQISQTQNPSVSINSQSQQNVNPIADPKPTFTFQFVPVSQNNQENAVPVQIVTNGQGQMTSQAGPTYYTQNQPTYQSSTAQNIPTCGQSQPIVFTVNQQPAGQNQPIVYTLQPTQRTSNQQNTPQSPKTNIATDNPMALMMSQLQTPSANPDMSSLLPMLMGSKQEKSGIKALLPLLLNLLTDKGCGCPHCGCPYNEPIINGGYLNQINYSQGLVDGSNIPESSKNIEESKKGNGREAKKYKQNVVNDVSEEVSDEDDEYEYDDD